VRRKVRTQIDSWYYEDGSTGSSSISDYRSLISLSLSMFNSIEDSFSFLEFILSKYFRRERFSKERIEQSRVTFGGYNLNTSFFSSSLLHCLVFSFYGHNWSKHSYVCLIIFFLLSFTLLPLDFFFLLFCSSQTVFFS